MVLTSHLLSAKLRKSSAHIKNMLHAAKNVQQHKQKKRVISTKVKKLKPFCRSRAYIEYAIESPSFDVINGTTRVSDPL